ncbi:MAG: hypothetical protein OEM59_00250 [Rhodospirillales bacterium]|nr:hypothetical protein [Rhodospirillales bacterium]
MRRAVADVAHQPAGGSACAPGRLELKQRINEMSKSARSRAEEQFTATQKKDKQALKEKEKARQEREEHVASLRALRLAKEAADKKAAE